MDMDFHYYGTYVAARLAGYTFDESKTIAYAAQYVNDSSREKLDVSCTPNFTPIPTSQTFTELADYDLDWNWSCEHLKETARIYIPFHFLPGNYGSNINKIPYSGKISDNTHVGYIFKYDSECEEQFKLLCLPNSILVEKTINDIIYNHYKKNYLLHMIGLRLHVISDTFAHSNFVGMPAWFINNVSETVYDISSVSNPVNLTTSWPLTTVSKCEDCEEASPDKPSYNSYVYFGHRRIGHIPDYPYIKYKYKPQWLDTFIERDNRSDFLTAFKQMITALKCIKNHLEFFVNSYANLNKETEAILKEILSTKKHDQSNAWKENISKIKINGASLEVPEDYNPNKWLDEARNTSEKTLTDYYNFNLSALLHFEFVKNSLQEDHIYMDEIPEENILNVTLQNKSGKFIGYSDNNYLIYPKMRKAGTMLSIIKPNSDILKSGDIVKIKTNDHTLGEYCYLGAWTKLSFYYYKKDFNTNKQKWEIEKVDCSVDNIIRSGDAVYIKNRYFSDEPYMAYYKYLNGSYYLKTTSSKLDNSIWFINYYIPETIYYNIIAKHSKKCLQIQNNNVNDFAPLIQFHADNNDSQKFKFVACGGGYFYIIAKHSEKYLQVKDSSTSDLAPIFQSSTNVKSNSNKFKLIPCGDGYYNIVAKHSQKCLEVEHNTSSDFAPIVQQHFKGTDSQKFKLEAVN